MTTSALPTDTADQAHATEGVAWVDPIGFVSGVIGTHSDGRQLSYVISRACIPALSLAGNTGVLPWHAAIK